MDSTGHSADADARQGTVERQWDAALDQVAARLDEVSAKLDRVAAPGGYATPRMHAAATPVIKRQPSGIEVHNQVVSRRRRNTTGAW